MKHALLIFCICLGTTLSAQCTLDLVINTFVPTCGGENIASVTADFSNGDTPTSVLILDENNSIINQNGAYTVDNLGSGKYYVVGFKDTCVTFDSVEFVIPEVMTMTHNTTSITCWGDETGSILINSIANQLGPAQDVIYNWTPDPNGISGIQAISQTNIGAGTYELNLIDSAGCSERFMINLFQPKHLAFKSIGPGPMAPNNTTSVTCEGLGGTKPYTYQWFDLNQNLLANDSVCHDLGPGDYVAMLTDANGCTFSDTTTVGWLNTSVHDYQQPNLFPTQTNGVLHYEHCHKSSILYLLDLNGRLIETIPLMESSGTISITVAKGIYLYQIHSMDQNPVSGQLIMQ